MGGVASCFCLSQTFWGCDSFVCANKTCTSWCALAELKGISTPVDEIRDNCLNDGDVDSVF